jgi:hypothetical protein
MAKAKKAPAPKMTAKRKGNNPYGQPKKYIDNTKIVGVTAYIPNDEKSKLLLKEFTKKLRKPYYIKK